MSDFPASAISSKDLSTSKANLAMDTTTSSLPQSTSLIQKYTYDMSYTRSNDLQQKEMIHGSWKTVCFTYFIIW